MTEERRNHRADGSDEHESAETIKRKRAVALGYHAGQDQAPRVRAKGRGYVAQEIIDRAQAKDIPIQEDESLVQLLSQLEINEKIPDSLYHVVAEVFAFVYRVDREQAQRFKKKE